MALDGPQENDETLNEKGVTFLVNKELFDKVKPISIDFIESAMGAGFMVQSALSNKDGGCGSGSCSC
jgi:Fe-S cluster assembly iron-binding protein IscA